MKILVDLQASITRYTKDIPAGATAIGVITTDGKDPGALVQFIDSGRYAQINHGHVRDIDQTATAIAHLDAMSRPACIKNNRPVGRPRLNQSERMTLYSVYLDDPTAEYYRTAGDGNLSLGIRTKAKQP